MGAPCGFWRLFACDALVLRMERPMLQKTIVFIYIIVLGAGLVSPAKAERNAALLNLEKDVLFRQMDNGAQVIVLNRGFSPTLSLIISFRAGSVDESYQTAGAAHMLEHMLFKGTDRVGTRDYGREKRLLEQIEGIGESLDRLRIQNPGDKRIPGLEKQLKKLNDEAARYVVSSPYDRLYTSAGGVGFNASTSRDRTSYVIDLPSSQIELWAQTESERLRNPVMREYYTERKTVVEERLMRYDSRGLESLYERFIATAFIAHPYRHPIIGWSSNVGFLSLRDVKEFYRSNYTPSRMTITVVGRQDPKASFAVIEKYFGRLEGKTSAPLVVIREPAHRGERRFEFQFDSSPHLLMGWNKPTFPSRDDYICDVIAGILTDGKTSRLYRSLLLEKKIAAAVSAWNGFPGARYDNLFVISAAPRHPHTPYELESAVQDEILRLRTDLGEEELKKVSDRMESALIFELESNKGIARALSEYQTLFGDWRLLLRYLDAIRGVSVKEVQGVLNRYFIKENRTVGVLLNKTEMKK